MILEIVKCLLLNLFFVQYFYLLFLDVCDKNREFSLFLKKQNDRATMAGTKGRDPARVS